MLWSRHTYRRICICVWYGIWVVCSRVRWVGGVLIIPYGSKHQPHPPAQAHVSLSYFPIGTRRRHAYGHFEAAEVPRLVGGGVGFEELGGSGGGAERIRNAFKCCHKPPRPEWGYGLTNTSVICLFPAWISRELAKMHGSICIPSKKNIYGLIL